MFKFEESGERQKQTLKKKEFHYVPAALVAASTAPAAALLAASAAPAQHKWSSFDSGVLKTLQNVLWI